MEAKISACFLLMIVNFPSHAVAQGDIESIVQNAVDRAFGAVSGGGETPPFPAFGPPDGASERRDLGPISARRESEPTRQEPGAVSGAAGALARFSQPNSPRLNAEISDRFSRIIKAKKMMAEELSKREGISFREALIRITNDPRYNEIFQRLVKEFCYALPTCDIGYPYRRVDGQCNNLRNPLLGSSGTPQQRVLRSAYDDILEGRPRRRSVKGADLPNARIVSNNVFQYLGGGMTPVSAVFSTYLTHHGQFIDHDVIATPSPKNEKKEDILDCCHKTRKYPHHCFNIEISREDPFFRGKTCMNFVRHSAAPELGCPIDRVREQTNDRTAFVDGSMVYGSTCTDERKLRGGLYSFGGRLAVNSQNLLPPKKDCPKGIITEYKCFLAGDHRPSETPTLTVPHITWMRRHNLIADALRQATGIQDDELLFQEAKRIVVAELQHITYNEFLAVLLDKYTRDFFNLRSRRRGHHDVYNSRIDPRTINGFGVAAYRMGHSLVRNVVGHHYCTGHIKEFDVSKQFERPDLMYNGGYEYMARWMSGAAKSKSDRFLVDGIRNRLFELPKFNEMHPSETLSFDLGALNIQRGRDHGIPSYNAYRQFCGLPRAHFFATSPGGLVDHSPQAVAALQRTYTHPDDIDLYAGGLSERPRHRGSILGPTFQCLIGLQFHLYKHGDRFWYERQFRENRLAAFTQDELAQIKQTTYSKIMCSVQNNNNGCSHSFQRNLFLRPHKISNPVQSCRRILRGNRLGFDIRPFARQLLSLGRRRYSASRASSCMTGNRGRVPDRF